jgi:phage gp36-like protein
MSYTANGDLLTIMAERILIQLSDDDPLAADPDWLVIAEARAYADGQIDARLRQRYRLPLASVPRELRDWAWPWPAAGSTSGARMARNSRRRCAMPPKEALAALDAVRDGKMSLAIASDRLTRPRNPGRRGRPVQVVAPERVLPPTLEPTEP